MADWEVKQVQDFSEVVVIKKLRGKLDRVGGLEVDYGGVSQLPWTSCETSARVMMTRANGEGLCPWHCSTSLPRPSGSACRGVGCIGLPVPSLVWLQSIEKTADDRRPSRSEGGGRRGRAEQ